MSRRLPSLNALRCFEVVAAQLSIKKAALVLNVSESAVSRQVKILEDQLGAALFTRSHNGLEITDAGRRLALSVKEAFDHIANAVNPFRSERDAVTIKVLPTFALRWLLPRLRGFQERHPLIKVNVHTRLNDMTLNDNDADLGIRYGIGNWPVDCASELYPEWILPVCAPGYLGGRVNGEADLAQATLLHPLPDRQDWLTWSEKSGTRIETRGGLDFDALDMALSAAEAGLGVAMTDVVLAHEAIQSGRLVVPLPKAVPTGFSYYLVRPPEMRRRREVALVDEWLCSEIEDARELVRRYAA
jgi:LysR family glycine cleavage system transcriptional activator